MTDALPEADALPAELVARDQWICWRTEHRDEKDTKVPVNPRTGGYASATDAETWTDFKAARAYAIDHDHGIGFVFTAVDPFAGVDLDDCRDPETGRPTEKAKAIVSQLDSYTEVSPSGTGYHVIVKGALPEGRNRRESVELYDDARFFTVTGDHVGGTPRSVTPRGDVLATVHTEHVAEVKAAEQRSEFGSAKEPSAGDDGTLLKKAKNAKNGQKFSRLWRGDTTGYESHSEADMALCCLLAFWTGGDAGRMDRLFRRSGLLREKWDEVHYGNGATYGEETIRRALTITDEFYSPSCTEHETAEQPSIEARLNREGDSELSDKQKAVYHAERARLFQRRVRKLEERLKLKEQRIGEIERQIEELASESKPLAPPQATGQNGSDTPNRSFRARLRRFIPFR